MENQKRMAQNPMEIKNPRRAAEEEQPKSVMEDLITDIISRLLAKDLVRFTCVSKSWHRLICTDTYLHRLQAERTASSHRPFLLKEKRIVETRSKRSLIYNFWIDLDSIEGHGIQLLQIINLSEITNPFDGDGDGRPRRDAQVIGSCHGLLLLQQQRSLKMAVSNPTTKKHVMVPPNPAGDANVVVCGLGYDRVHDCCKVVTKVKHRLELMVYDLHKGTWRSIRFGTWWRSQYHELEAIHNPWVDDNDWNDYSVKCVDVGVYWCIEIEETERAMFGMVCFLLAEEEFHVVEHPGLGRVKYYPNMTVLDERLCLMCSHSEYNGHGHEVWSLHLDDDNGKRQWRWTKLFAIPDVYATLPPYPNDPEDPDVVIPVCFSGSKQEILIHRIYDGRLLWYDLGKKEFRKFNNLGRCFDARSSVSRIADLGFLLKNMK